MSEYSLLYQRVREVYGGTQTSGKEQQKITNDLWKEVKSQQRTMEGVLEYLSSEEKKIKNRSLVSFFKRKITPIKLSIS